MLPGLSMDKDINEMVQDVKNIVEKDGFEVHPFKIGWYNDCVQKPFVFPYNYDTFALVVISTPDMFDKAFKPFICREECIGALDPLDRCIKHYFQMIKEKYKDIEIEAIHDFELNHNRRPKVLVQTAAHVAGAAYYYQKKDLPENTWNEKQKIFGVSVHPKYGGWFAIRGVLIFKDILAHDLIKTEPKDIVHTQELRKELLERFNYNWQDWTFRDIVPVDSRYSEEQKDYFAMPPGQRKSVIDKIKKNMGAY